MALTKTDLQQIGNVVDERLERRLTPIEKGLTDVTKDLKYLKKKVSRIDKTVSVLVDRSDREETLLKIRVSKIERHLSLPQN